MKTISMTEFRKEPGKILHQVSEHLESFLILKDGKPVAKLIQFSVDDIIELNRTGNGSTYVYTKNGKLIKE